MIASEIAHWMGLLPVGVCLWMSRKGRSLDTAFWVLGIAYGVSWLADTAAHFVNPWIASASYPVAQASLIGAVFLGRSAAVRFLYLLATCGIFSAVLRASPGPDLVLNIVASGGVTLIALEHAIGHLRNALVVTFGLGIVAYVAWVVDVMLNGQAGVRSWYPMQAVRLVGTLWFCYAVMRPRPALSLLRARAA